MELRRELLLTVGTLVLLNLALAFGAIGLFVRMGPAIERILQNNVATIVAAEDVLAELALAPPGALSDSHYQLLHDALETMHDNVTESSEEPVIEALRDDLRAARAGSPGAKERLVEGAREVIRINRAAMHEVDEEARRLGSAGAWAAVLIGFGSFLLSLLLVVRLQSRLVRPLIDLHEVLQAARRGNRMRRCRMSSAPVEVQQVTEVVNELLDERLHSGAATGSGIARTG